MNKSEAEKIDRLLALFGSIADTLESEIEEVGELRGFYMRGAVREAEAGFRICTALLKKYDGVEKYAFEEDSE